MRRVRGCVLAAVSLVVVITGCSKDPRSLLGEMSRAYRVAERYRDDGRVRIQYRRGEVEVDHTEPFRVAFERPDRIRVECYDARVVADGTTLRAAVGNVPGQVLTESVKSPLSLDQLFADEELRRTLSEGVAGCPTQLALLLADDTIELILAEAVTQPRVSGIEHVDGRSCTKIDVEKPDGTLTLWIDAETKLLRRLSLPTSAYAAFLTQQVGPVSGVRVVADFEDASCVETIPKEAFVFEAPASARAVASLEPVRSPDPPSELIGRVSPPFTLVGADGGTVSRERLAGRLVVLGFFSKEDGENPRWMPLVERAVETLRGKKNGAIEYSIVSVDDAEVSDDAIIEAAKEAGGLAPVLRDPRGVAAAAFEIGSLPAVVVLAPDGTVADVQRGDHDRIGDDVLEIAEMAMSGTATAARVRRRFERRLADYREAIDAASGAAEALPEQVIAPKRQPDRFKLVRAWRAADVAMPGNIIRVDPSPRDASGRPGLVVLDGWRSVVELDLEGREKSRHELDLPKDAAIGFLRTTIDEARARWWLGAAVGGQHVFIFDASWKLRATYPAIGGPQHAGIAAAEFVAPKEDGPPGIVIGYFGNEGLHGVSLGGERLWKEPSVVNVAGMAVDAADPKGRTGVVVIDGRGRLLRVGPDGRADAPREIADWRIRSIFGGPVGTTESLEPSWSLLAIAGVSLGRTSLVGLGAEFAPRWDRPLPDGIHRDGPIEPVAWADLLGSRRRQWIVAAADGSVLVLWDDGGLVDRYCHGEPIVGLAGFVSDGAGHIVIATRSSVQAFRMDDVALD